MTNVIDQTANFKLNLPTFDLRLWHTYVNENFDVIDAVLGHYLNVENLTGVWRNSTVYNVGDRAVDPDQGAIYECALGNTSAPLPTTFAQERANNPFYWRGVTVPQAFRGTWTNSTSYTINDFVVSGNIYAVCATSHTSSPVPHVFADDVVYWIYLINLSGLNLPSITGNGLSYLRAKGDESALEYRTPTQVKADLGISNIVTSFNTRIGDILLNASDISSAGGAVVTGATFTGNVGISPATSAVLVLNKNASGFANQIIGQTAGSARWQVVVGNSVAETGSNNGSDFAINRFSDAGTFIDTPLLIQRGNAVMTLGASTALALQANLAHQIQGGAGTVRALYGTTSGSIRWQLVLAGSGAESGSNAGSDFAISRYTDGGAPIDSPITISRQTGIVTINSGVTGAGIFYDTGRNKFDNALIRITQRGFGPFTTNQVFNADRWFQSISLDTLSTSVIAATDAVRTAIGDEDITNFIQYSVTGNAGAAAFTFFCQRVEGVRRLAGKQLTISFWAASSVVGNKIGVSCDQVFGTGGSPSAAVNTANLATFTSPNANWVRYSATFTMPSIIGKTLGTNGDDFTQVDFWLSCGANNNSRAGTGVQTGLFQFWGFQIEEGPVATKIEKIDPHTDFARCSRHYQTGSWNIVSYGAAGALGAVQMTWPYPFRGVPNVTPTPGTQTNCSGSTIGSINAKQYTPQTTITALGTFNTSGSWTASAEL